MKRFLVKVLVILWFVGGAPQFSGCAPDPVIVVVPQPQPAGEVAPVPTAAIPPTVFVIPATPTPVIIYVEAPTQAIPTTAPFQRRGWPAPTSEGQKGGRTP